MAVLAALPFALAAAFLLVRVRFPGKTLVDGFLHLPLVLPPVVVGYLLLITFGTREPIGALSIDRTFDWGHYLGAQGRLAVGDPDHVPAGIYAKEALTNFGAWATLEPRLARAEDVRGALALVEHGDAPLGVVYVTDARASTHVKIVGVFPAGSHSPIVYPFAIVKGAGTPAVQAYFRFLTGPEARTVFSRYGFAAP